MSLGNHIQTADFKLEKHVPAIDAPAKVEAGKAFKVEVAVGKEDPHPNTTEHFIESITLYFKPTDDKFAYVVGEAKFTAHGASAAGANKGPVYTDPFASFTLKINKPGELIAVGYCNIHGLWESSKKIDV